MREATERDYGALLDFCEEHSDMLTDAECRYVDLFRYRLERGVDLSPLDPKHLAPIKARLKRRVNKVFQELDF